MAKRLESGEELHLLVSPKSRHLHQGYGPTSSTSPIPWSNERRKLRTLSEHLYSPLRLPLSRIDVLNTLMAPVVNLVVVARHPHEDDARVHRPRVGRAADPRLPPDELSALRAGSRTPSSSTPRACARRSSSYLKVDPRKLKLIYEAVDHDLFKPGDAARPGAGRGVRRDQAVRALRLVAVAVQELRRAAAGVGARPR